MTTTQEFPFQPYTNFTIKMDDLAKIWLPRFAMFRTTLNNMQEDHSFRSMYLYTEVEGRPAPITENAKRTVFEGADVDLVLQQWFRSEIICDFTEFENLPFDMNVCSFQETFEGQKLFQNQSSFV